MSGLIFIYKHQYANQNIQFHQSNYQILLKHSLDSGTNYTEILHLDQVALERECKYLLSFYLLCKKAAYCNNTMVNNAEVIEHTLVNYQIDVLLKDKFYCESKMSWT